MTTRDFKTRLAAPDVLLAPGVYDALSALVAEQAGFEALYLSSASIAYTRLGRSDIGLATFTEVADTLAHITERVRLPVIVDADTGFGNALNTQRTVRGFERAGAAMVQIEDQTFPKRCGHLDGKALVPQREMAGKLKAALDARSSNDTLILARTDAVAVEGLQAALDRAEAYLECGVDALFIEALRSPGQMDAACRRFAHRVPLLANMVEGGKTPLQDADTLQRRGFRIAIFPGGTARAVVHTLQGYYASLHRHRTTQPWRGQMLDFDALNAVIGTPELMRIGQRYD
ncbi:isocitrate lyase/PEP mutase family protein [Verminephrobacter eiseniae]|uniref:2,3-dimethylmalate lyase n=1 Tax=Verminephrobacter eiseniae (strain EF01-2) TaxID=391735 RepID=A1WJ62_VEREI|nr:isocitrate lyase/phosphoenolpyruvate mutase family protein [Verminephrobacter eiseniae]ABM57669.1 2,3-dimethylmalate lyase [Verminephrobacter eiseniae EF01-2]MCW5234704.1 carboxyvinyl-carboxyphosphonate phosphorylmutase [Verminephrobacter eiseniae]MCW5283287.1 carboxyvinyl-carboxyphosphonate phosphorylmutase [Verminephrobacter eiseniae]MCW5293721.1 carboxyvinyl-carboxyphosphonate phosphorylmutase [Verminephrobacter eiseniae]MCW5303603.1 carboxyvinyl-carboxyphosphonate phosphorylmutase [Verm